MAVLGGRGIGRGGIEGSDCTDFREFQFARKKILCQGLKSSKCSKLIFCNITVVILIGANLIIFGF